MGKKVGKKQRVTREEDKIREKALEQDYQDKCNALACRLKDHRNLLELILQLTCCNGEDLCNSTLCQELKERHAHSITLIKFLLEKVGTTLDVLPKQTQVSLHEMLCTDEKLRAKLEKSFQFGKKRKWKSYKAAHLNFSPAAQGEDSSSGEEFYQMFVHGIKDERPLVLMLKQGDLGQALRDVVQEKCPKLPSSFILLHQGRKISLGHTLREQGLTQDCNIHVHFALYGGMEKEKQDSTLANGRERINKGPQKWKKAEVVKWINEVCEMYEIDEGDVSKLKTLSGAGLNQLDRQDWIERSPNQGDFFFKLWIKLTKTSQETDVSDITKSPLPHQESRVGEKFRFCSLSFPIVPSVFKYLGAKGTHVNLVL
ncbi:hypothetical protein OS493_005422 [Desmophyllum pertusum]|uniref:Ubiquitin-like domain-containing protein n=1 Tax=Desmophyllum pertusum TaxID=174260 RepID=A0A9W9YUZ0_9CNID|nr:hypothetical protein OS493_005422 [Desmophyllum pertusum]